MVATNKLRGIIVEKGLSQRYVAHHLGITENTFYSKMKRGVFDSDEMEAMINLLEIQNPCEIFFASDGALYAPRVGGTLHDTTESHQNKMP